MARKITPTQGRVWTEGNLSHMVEVLLLLKRNGINFFTSPFCKEIDPPFLSFLKRFHEEDWTSDHVHIYASEDALVPVWKLLPGERGLGVWTNVERL